MVNNLNRQVVEMYRDGATNKKIRLTLGVKDIELKEILERHRKDVKPKVLDTYDKEALREGIKDRICRDFCIKTIDLDEWLSLRKLKKKAKNIIPEKKERLRIQNGFSPWISYIVEKCYLEHMWRDKK